LLLLFCSLVFFKHCQAQFYVCLSLRNTNIYICVCVYQIDNDISVFFFLAYKCRINQIFIDLFLSIYSWFISISNNNSFMR
jgi:hypothetical protein